jgi:hypothetical protein
MLWISEDDLESLTRFDPASIELMPGGVAEGGAALILKVDGLGGSGGSDLEPSFAGIVLV